MAGAAHVRAHVSVSEGAGLTEGAMSPSAIFEPDTAVPGLRACGSAAAFRGS